MINRWQAGFWRCGLADTKSNKKYGSFGLRLRWQVFDRLAKFPRSHEFAVELYSLPWRNEFQSRLHDGRLSARFGKSNGRVYPLGVSCRIRERKAELERTRLPQQVKDLIGTVQTAGRCAIVDLGKSPCKRISRLHTTARGLRRADHHTGLRYIYHAHGVDSGTVERSDGT